MHPVAADLFFHGGLSPIPIPRGAKAAARPFGHLAEHPPARERLERDFPLTYDGNFGVLAGRASANLVIVDADERPAFDGLAAGLDFLGLSTWCVLSPRGGHIYLRLPWTARSTGGGVVHLRGQAAYALAPGSIHPSGSVYLWAEPRPPAIAAIEPADISRLTGCAVEPADPPEPRRRLPALAWRLLTGDAEVLARYPSRSEAEAAICAGLLNAGLPFAEALRLFTTLPGPGKFRELYQRAPQEAARYLRHTWERAAAFVQSHPSPAVLLARQCRAWAEARPWPGRTGSSDRAVFLAFCAVVARCGHNPAGASARQLAELAGVTWPTAAAALRRLSRAGLIEQVQPAGVTLPAVWRLVGGQDLSLPHVGVEGVTSFARADGGEVPDLWRRAGGLGPAGAEAWSVLRAGAATAAEIVAATGRSRRTVARCLERMWRLGLVEPLGDGSWRALPDADLDAAARAVGVAGAGARQRERHRQERAAQRAIWRCWRQGAPADDD